MSSKSTFSNSTSASYAVALYELSKEENQTSDYASSLSSFMRIYNSNQELKNFVKNPTHSVKSQKEIFEKILGIMNFNKVIKNFFSVLIIKKRIFFLDIIIEEFLKLISQKKGEISANLISSKKIDEKTIFDIEKEISENIKGSIKLKSKVDESLIGGVIIQIGSLMIDTSIKNKLAKYKKAMMES